MLALTFSHVCSLFDFRAFLLAQLGFCSWSHSHSSSLCLAHSLAHSRVVAQRMDVVFKEMDIVLGQRELFMNSFVNH